MKHNRIRIMLIPMVLCSLLLTPAGCGGGSQISEEEKAMEKYESPAVNKKPASIRIYFPGEQPKSWPDVKAKMEESIAGSINATLDFKWIDFQSYFQRMAVLDSSEEPFDAFVVGKPEERYPNFTKLAREGKLKDITTLFPENAPGLMEKFTKEELGYGRIDGKLYAVPSLYPHAYATYLMADDTLLKKFNISELTNYEQYDAFLKTVKKNEPDLIPGTIANSVDSLKLLARGAGYVIVDEVQKLVYKWDDPEMKVTAWEKTPEFKEAISYVADWFKKGYLIFNPEQTKVASFVYYGDLSKPSEETTKMTFSDSSGNIKESNPLRIFYLYSDKKVQRESPIGRFFFNGSFVFPASSANTDRALQFLNWVQQSRENYNLMVNGIEGKDYVLKEGYPLLPEGMNYNNSTYMYWPGSFGFRNIDYMFSSSEGSNMDPAKEQKQFIEKNSQYAPHGALYPDYKNIQETADSRAALFTQFESRIGSGQIKDASEIDSFIKEMDDLGTASLIAEVQKQLNESVKDKDK